MLRLLGIRPSRFLIALAGMAALVAGLVIHRPVLTVIGGLAIVWSAVTLIAGRRGGAK